MNTQIILRNIPHIRIVTIAIIFYKKKNNSNHNEMIFPFTVEAKITLSNTIWHKR